MKSIMRAWLVMTGVLALAGCALPADNSIVSDGFNRADSFTVGNSWTESEPGDPATPAAVSIIGNKLVCQGGLLGASAVFGTVYRGGLSFSAHVTTVNFSMDNNSYFTVQLYNTQSPGVNYYQLQISPAALTLYKMVSGAPTSLGTTGFSFNPAHAYRLVVSYASSQFTINLHDLTAATTAALSVNDSTYLLFGLVCIGGGNYTGGTAYKTYVDSVLVERQ
jgi:hypothetical protein